MTTDEYFRQHGEHREFLIELLTSAIDSEINGKTSVLNGMGWRDSILAADILRAMGEPVPYYTLPTDSP